MYEASIKRLEEAQRVADANMRQEQAHAREVDPMWAAVIEDYQKAIETLDPKKTLLADAVKLIEQLHSELYECLTTYAMTEDAQGNIMRLLREATLFRRQANADAHVSTEAQRF
jgi:hypothetical protein